MAYLLDSEVASLPKFKNNYIGVAVGGKVSFEPAQLTLYIQNGIFKTYKSESASRPNEEEFLVRNGELGTQVADTLTIVDLFTPRGGDLPGGTQLNEDLYIRLRTCAEVLTVIGDLTSKFDFNCNSTAAYRDLRDDLVALTKYVRIATVNLMLQSGLCMSQQEVVDSLRQEQGALMTEERLQYDHALNETFDWLMNRKEPLGSVVTDEMTQVLVKEANPQIERLLPAEQNKVAKVWLANELRKTELFQDLYETRLILPLTEQFYVVRFWEPEKLAEEFSDAVLLFMYKLAINYKNAQDA